MNNPNIKIKYFPFLLLLGAIGCKVTKSIQAQESVAGTYSRNDREISHRLLLNPNSTFLYYTPPYGERPQKLTYEDTISYGNWSLETEGLLSLSSPKYLSKALKIKVEENVGEHPDTVYIKINNPVEKDLSTYSLRRNVIYGAVVSVYNDFLVQIKAPEPSNLIKFYNPKKLPIESIRIVAYPILRDYDGFILANYYEGLIAAETETCSIRPISNYVNHFAIEIPDLTNEFLIYRRLNRDFIKIIDNNQLEWDGQIFKRENK